MPMIHIPRGNRRFGGTVSVGLNGRIFRIPVGVDYSASDEEVAALAAADIPTSVPTIPAGSIMIPSSFGTRIAAGLNGVIRYLLTGVSFVPTEADLAVLNDKHVSYWVGGGTPTPTPTPTPTIITAMVMGQSEMEYEFNTSGIYRNIAQPTPGNGNLIVYTQDAAGAAPVRTVVNPTTVAAGQVNPAMAALSALLAYVEPTKTFIVGDGAVAGTNRASLIDDRNDDPSSGDGRRWADFASVVSAIEAETGAPVGNLIECWYNADASLITTFRTNFWPMYFGANPDGTPFTLGTVGPGSVRVDHCLYDASAAPSAKGRGVFARSATKWHVLTPMPFYPQTDDVEVNFFSEGSPRLSEPARATMIALTANSLAQSVNLTVGPSAHISKFGGASTRIHPDVGDKDGQVLLMWPIAVALLRAAGRTIGEPEIVGIEGPSDGSYVDLLVTLPNGGNLTTLAAFRGSPAYSGSAPHQQPVTGVEITRSSTRKPVFKTSETSRPAAYRGTVTIVDAGTGSGAARRGKVRITPTQAFAAGDAVSYLRGQGTATLMTTRDFDLYRYMLIEHIPAFYNAAATYPFEGVAVKPYQDDLPVPITAPFVARGAKFDGASYFASTSIAVPGGANGMFSMWLRSGQTAWGSPSNLRLAQWRIGSTIAIELIQATGGKLSVRINNDTVSDTAPVFASPPVTATRATGSTTMTNVSGTLVPGAVISGTGIPSGTTVVSYDKAAATAVISAASTSNITGAIDQGFAPSAWYHVLCSWKAGAGGTGLWEIYVNGLLVSTVVISSVDWSGVNLTQIGIGASSTGTAGWVGDIAHYYMNLSETLDFSIAANRAKFMLNGQPVDLGSTGQLPTGNAPAYYYDGDGPAFSNRGTAGNVAGTGTLTSSGAPSFVP